MAKRTKLGSLAAGQTGTVAEINGTSAVMMRLMEIGLIPGRPVSVLRRAPFGGPVELLVDRTRIAVRVAEANCVQITTDAVVSSPSRLVATAEPVPTA